MPSILEENLQWARENNLPIAATYEKLLATPGGATLYDHQYNINNWEDLAEGLAEQLVAESEAKGTKDFLIDNARAITGVGAQTNSQDFNNFVQTLNTLPLTQTEANNANTAMQQGVQDLRQGQASVAKFYSDFRQPGDGFGNLAGDVGRVTAQLAANPVVQAAIVYYMPGVVESLAPSLSAVGITNAAAQTAVASAITSTAVQVASGVPLENAVKNAVVNAVVSTGTAGVAKDINAVFENPIVANAIVNATTTVAQGVLSGRSSDQIEAALTGSLAGSAAALVNLVPGFADLPVPTKNVISSSIKASFLDKPIGDAATQALITSGVQAAANGVIANKKISDKLGRPATEDEIKQFAFYSNPSQVNKDIDTYIKSKSVDENQVRSAFAEQGVVNLTPQQIEKYVKVEANPAELLEKVKKEADSLYTDPNEVKEQFKAVFGRDPNENELKDLQTYVGEKPEQDTLATVERNLDPLFTDLTESRQIYKDIYGKEGTDEQVKAFVGETPEANVLRAIQNNINKEVKTYDDEFGDYQGAIDKAAALPKEKVSFKDAFAAARASYGPGREFTWTDAKGVTGVYATGTADELKAQEIADQKRIDLMPVYGGSQNTRAGRPSGKEDVYINTKTGDVVTDTREFDANGNLVSGSLDLADKNTTTGAINTAVGSSVRTALDVGAGFIKGGGNLLEQVGTFGGLLGADMDNVVRMTGKQIQSSISEMRSDEFKDKQNVMNKAIQAAGGEGNFAQIVETFKQGGANPVQTAAFIVEQGTTLLVGGGAMTAARALGAGMTVAEAAALTANALTQGSSVASEVYDDNVKQGFSKEDALTRARAAGGLATFTSAIANKFIPGALSNEAKIAYGGTAKDSLKKALIGEISSEEAEELSGKVIGNMLSGKAWDTDLGTTAVHALVGSGVITGAVHVGASDFDPIKDTPKTQFDDVSGSQFNAAFDTLMDEGYTTPTTKELIDIISASENKSTEEISKIALEYADPISVTEEEVKAAFANEGILIPTEQEIADYFGLKNEQETIKTLIEYADPRALTRNEVETLFAEQGYTPSKQEVDDFVNYILNPEPLPSSKPNVDPNVNTEVNPNVDPNVNTEVNPNVNPNVSPEVNLNVDPNVNTGVNPNVDPNVNTGVNPNVNPNVNTGVNPNVNPNNYEKIVSNILSSKYDFIATSPEEIKALYTEIGYDPTDEEIQQFVGNLPEAEQTELARKYGLGKQAQAARKRRNKYGQLVAEGEVDQEPSSIIAPTSNVFYYGKEFGSTPQQISASGEVSSYRPVDLTTFGPDYDAMLGLPAGTLSALPAVQAAAVTPQQTGIAQAPNTGENTPIASQEPSSDESIKFLQDLLSKDPSLTEEDLMKILQESGSEFIQ